jgi:hydrogenase nickel incorporation protein HypA/HybF
MHELGLANGIFDIVRQYVPASQAAAVRRVRVDLGARANVVPESLAFCFDAIVTGTLYSQAFLTLDPGGDDFRVREIELEETP